MAARYPHATWKPLGAQTEPTMTGHHLVIAHTMVGFLYSTDTMFRRNGYSGTEAHYGIGGKWGSDATHGLDGVVWQWQDRARQADANLEANATAISIETADNAPAKASDIAPWTDAQVAALIDLIAWECSPAAHAGCPSSWTCHTHGIPAELVPDSKPGRRGIGYHRQGIDPWRVDGGQRWSTAYGKECPGTARIAQLTKEIIPAVQARLKGADMPTPKEMWNWDGIDPPKREADPTKNPKWQPDSYLRHTLNATDAANAKLDALAARQAALEAKVDALAGKLSALDATAITAAVEGAVDTVRTELAALRLSLVVTD